MASRRPGRHIPNGKPGRKSTSGIAQVVESPQSNQKSISNEMSQACAINI